MPRTRYTRLVRARDEARLNQQLRDLHHLARELRRQPLKVVELPVALDLKQRRRARLEQKRHRKSVPAEVRLSA